MTDSPPWVKAGLSAIKFSDNLRLSAEPITNDYQNLDMEKVRKLVSTYTREGVSPFRRAGNTCLKCPQPFRAYETYATDEVVIGEKADGTPDIVLRPSRGAWDLPKSKWVYTKRCTKCGNRAKSWSRAMKKASRIELVSTMLNMKASFVTLTFPNWVGGHPKEGIKFMKNLIVNFRKDFRDESKEIHGYDFFEYTVHPDFRGWSNPWEFNIHQHGLWVMKYWNQKDFQKAWSHGIVHTKRLKGTSLKNAARYATKYTIKSDIIGRNSQAFGACYGRAYAELESQAKHLVELQDVADVKDCQET